MISVNSFCICCFEWPPIGPAPCSPWRCLEPEYLQRVAYWHIVSNTHLRQLRCADMILRKVVYKGIVLTLLKGRPPSWLVFTSLDASPLSHGMKFLSLPQMTSILPIRNPLKMLYAAFGFTQPLGCVNPKAAYSIRMQKKNHLKTLRF